MRFNTVMTPPLHHYVLYGMTVESEVCFGQAAPENENAVSDQPRLRIARGTDRPVPASLPIDTLDVARFDSGGRTYYIVGRSRNGWVIRYPELLDVILDAAAENAVAHLDPTAPDGFAPMVLSAGVLAFVLTIRGELVLHASCLEIEGRAVALAADTGGGKSTLAALVCAGGARLVSDDITRVDPSTSAGAAVFRGSREVRLRPHGPDVMELLARFPQRRTVDNRTAIAVPMTVSASVPLAHVLLPVLREDLSAPTLEPVGAEQAVLILLRKLRAGGIRDGRFVDRQFSALADLASRVPVSLLQLPWTRPFTRVQVDSYVEVIRGAAGTEFP